MTHRITFLSEVSLIERKRSRSGYQYVWAGALRSQAIQKYRIQPAKERQGQWSDSWILHKESGRHCALGSKMKLNEGEKTL